MVCNGLNDGDYCGMVCNGLDNGDGFEGYDIVWTDPETGEDYEW